MAQIHHHFRIDPLTFRIGLGKLLGGLIGVAVFFSLPSLQADIDPALRFGMLGWYIIFGAIIGFAGIYEKCPVFGFKFPTLLRGAVLGFGLNIVLGCLVHDNMIQAFSKYSEFQFSNSIPVLQIAIEGLIWGTLLDFILTRYAGQGKELLKNL
jgi:hypothetical protein